MTLHTIESSPHSLRLLFRISLAMLVMILAERAASVSQGDPEVDSAPNKQGFLAADQGHTKDLQPHFSDTDNHEDNAATQRVREGTMLIDVTGHFKVSGDRTSFIISETGQSFGGLENLNLARVANILVDDADAEWTVSGVVTEYRGLNFLLVHKAVRKASTPGQRNANRPR